MMLGCEVEGKAFLGPGGGVPQSRLSAHPVHRVVLQDPSVRLLSLLLQGRGGVDTWEMNCKSKDEILGHQFEKRL